MSKPLTIKEAAASLGWSYDYTRRMLSGLKPVQTIGANKLYSREQIESVRPTPPSKVAK